MSFNSSTDGWSNCRDAWLYFPGIKVGHSLPYSSFLAILGGVDYKSLRSHRLCFFLSYRRLTLDCNCFLSVFVFFSQWGFTKNLTCRTTAIRLVLYLTTFSVGRKSSHSKIFEIFKHLKQIAMFKTIFWPRGACRHTGTSSYIQAYMDKVILLIWSKEKKKNPPFLFLVIFKLMCLLYYFFARSFPFKCTLNGCWTRDGWSLLTVTEQLTMSIVLTNSRLVIS